MYREHHDALTTPYATVLPHSEGEPAVSRCAANRRLVPGPLLALLSVKLKLSPNTAAAFLDQEAFTLLPGDV